jgi:hypothetical protein
VLDVERQQTELTSAAPRIMGYPNAGRKS